MTKVTVFLSGLVFFVMGCAHQPSTQDNQRLTRLSRQNRDLETRREQQRLQGLLQKEKEHHKKWVKKLRPLPKVLTEETLYTQVINAYQGRDFEGVDHYSEEFVKRYPQSVFADNALYLKGQLSLSIGLPAEALRAFEKILQNYPLGNKRASAVFGKAVAYRKLQLYPYAEKALQEVKKDFSGSPEALKVDIEEKLLQLEKAG